MEESGSRHKKIERESKLVNIQVHSPSRELLNNPKETAQNKPDIGINPSKGRLIIEAED